MQYKILASDYDNTLVPFGEGKPRQKVVKAVKKLQAAGGKSCSALAVRIRASTSRASWAASGSITPSPATVPVWWTARAASWPSTRSPRGNVRAGGFLRGL